ncbi:MAG TPA: tetratricopeptide repeat protein [Chthoniobacterales bacterium]
MKTFVLLLALVASALAQEADPVASAAQPLNDGVPEVAVVRLRTLLETAMPDDARRGVELKLAEALIAADRAQEALQVLTNASHDDSSEAKFLRAQTLAALERWSEALPLYAQAAADRGFAKTSEAEFGQAEALRALARNDEALAALNRLMSDQRWSLRARFTAIEILLGRNDVDAARKLLNATKPATPSERKERRLLAGRVEWQSHRSLRAVQMFASIAKNPQGATRSVLLAALYAIADAHLALGTPDSGDDYLEDYIEHHASDSQLARVFAKLDQLYAAEQRQSRHELGRWAREEPQPRRALSQWYLARAELRLGHRESARDAFAQLRQEQAPIAERGLALLEYASLLLRDHDAALANAVLADARASQPPRDVLEQIDFLAADAQYAAGDYRRAATTFQQIKTNPALVNASFAWLAAGDPSQASATAQELNARGADEQTRGDVALEAGLTAAARGDKDAPAALQKFLRDFPKHPRISEAWVALAELAFRAALPRVDEARQDLAHANESNPTPAASERGDYLSIWLEEAAPKSNDERAIELASEFIAKHGQSPLLGDVRLKLAEIYYRRQDFASAQTQFELLAQQNPNAPLAEKAQFFAAESAMNSMAKNAFDRALVLFNEVVKRNGELKWPARNEQAVIERKLGKREDALTLYDEVLRGDAKPAEKREALCGKGDTYYELGTADPENYRRAIDYYNQLGLDRDPHWRNQAIFKKGMCLEKLNATDEALATFYSIVENETRPDRQREFFWLYKAGFNAARLLEQSSKWQAAAAVYEKLAFAGGSRSEEAKSRLNTLRLEHFLWEE